MYEAVKKVASAPNKSIIAKGTAACVCGPMACRFGIDILRDSKKDAIPNAIASFFYGCAASLLAQSAVNEIESKSSASE